MNQSNSTNITNITDAETMQCIRLLLNLKNASPSKPIKKKTKVKTIKKRSVSFNQIEKLKIKHFQKQFGNRRQISHYQKMLNRKARKMEQDIVHNLQNRQVYVMPTLVSAIIPNVMNSQANQYRRQ